jgi:hypothetical protein
MALAFLILVFLFVIALLALFIFPPERLVEFLGTNKKK